MTQDMDTIVGAIKDSEFIDMSDNSKIGTKNEPLRWPFPETLNPILQQPATQQQAQQSMQTTQQQPPNTQQQMQQQQRTNSTTTTTQTLSDDTQLQQPATTSVSPSSEQQQNQAQQQHSQLQQPLLQQPQQTPSLPDAQSQPGIQSKPETQQTQQQSQQSQSNQQSQSSPPQTTANQSRFIDLNDDVPTCRICHCTELNKLISPCHCSGSLKWVHHSCLQQWLSATNSQRCELCKYQFSMTVKYKPLHKWGALNATATDRRKLICNSVFNLISMICVFWSIYVLVERASLDARIGQIDWSFWTKMCVITIGFIGGVIFLFVQLRFYFSIFIRWRQSNRIIVIRNANLNELKLN